MKFSSRHKANCINIVVINGCDGDDEIHVVPYLDACRESKVAVQKTPAYQSQRKLRGELLMGSQMTDTQFTTIRPKFTDKKGNPSKVDGPPTWLTDNSELLALEPSADGLTCKVSAVGPIGTATVSMKADADMGAGVTEVAGLFEVEVISGATVTVTLEADAPQDIPPTP